MCEREMMPTVSVGVNEGRFTLIIAVSLYVKPEMGLLNMHYISY